jgi:hypothetical protein
MWKSLLLSLSLALPAFGAQHTEIAIPPLKLCINANLNGCQDVGPGWENACYNVPGSLNDKISSLQIHTGCTFYENSGCVGGGIRLLAGTYNTIPASMNDRISSYKCV